MKLIDRNPDINLHTQKIPTGMHLVQGKNLQQTARAKKIPFGVAFWPPARGSRNREETVGLIIRDEHADAMRAAMAVRGAKYQPKASK